MRKVYIVLFSFSCFVLGGCNNTANQPNYSLFKNVSADRMDKIKNAIQQSGIKSVELPTYSPYLVTSANIPENGEPPNQLIIFFGDSKHAIGLELQQAQSATLETLNESQTKLSDGTKATYGNNGAVSELAWDKDGVFYILSSSTDANKPDLTEKQLVEVADSFA